MVPTEESQRLATAEFLFKIKDLFRHTKATRRNLEDIDAWIDDQFAQAGAQNGRIVQPLETFPHFNHPNLYLGKNFVFCPACGHLEVRPMTWDAPDGQGEETARGLPAGEARR